jgi:hypothetical protein
MYTNSPFCSIDEHSDFSGQGTAKGVVTSSNPAKSQQSLMICNMAGNCTQIRGGALHVDRGALCDAAFP